MGQENLKRLVNLKVGIVGLGAVGSFIFEFLIRLGVRELVVVDDDAISEADINRNLLADRLSVGRYKVDVAKELADRIGEDILVRRYRVSVGKFSDIKFLDDLDFVFDAIDGLNAKAVLIEFLLRKNIAFVVAGGCSGKVALDAKVADIWDVRGDRLISRLRGFLRRRGIKQERVPVVYSDGSFLFGKNIRGNFLSRDFIGSRGRVAMGSCILTPAVVSAKMVGYFLEKILE